MNEDIFEQAPLPMLTRWQVGDKVKLLTFPVGDGSASYQLDVTIRQIIDGEFEGVVVKAAPVGRVPASVKRHFEAGTVVEFRAAHIQGNAGRD